MQGNVTHRLVVRRGPQPNQVYELTGDVTNLGRDITNDIVINDREVSRHHLRFMRGIEGYTIEDLGSTNGTFINGKRVQGAQPLNNGDMVGLGETVTLGYEVIRPGSGVAPTPDAAPAPAPDAAFQPPQQPQGAPIGDPNPYQPPQQQPVQPQYQPQPDAYQQPAQDGYQQPAPAYGGDPAFGGDPAYQQPGQDIQGDAGYYGANYGSMPPGYDPYAIREEGGGGMARWLLFGCLGLLVFCCCVTTIGAVIVDTFRLYCDVPVVGEVVSALGLYTCP